MRILFVCPSLEAGRDGVGDYTRRLACALTSLGHECLCIAINDNKLQAETCSEEEEASSETGVRALRFSARLGWEERLPLFREAVQGFAPDWISLQYVPWGYDPKGLPRHFARRLSAVINELPLHIMCHELWMEGAWFSIKNRLLGALQKPLCRELFTILRPEVVHTQTSLYRDMLRRIGVQSEILPLHGNIAVSCSRGDGQTWLSKRIGSSAGELCFGFFGEIHASLDRERLASFAKECAEQTNAPWILSGGILTASSLAVWEGLKRHFTDKTRFLLLGRLEEREVSHYLSGLTMGLTSYPPEFVGKSGGVAAMLEHGLAVRLLGRSLRNGDEVRGDFLFPQNATSVFATAKRLTEALSARAQEPHHSHVS